jgi:hypothetical protein
VHWRRHEGSRLTIPSHPRCGQRPSSGQAVLPTGSVVLHLPVPLTTPVQSDHIEAYSTPLCPRSHRRILSILTGHGRHSCVLADRRGYLKLGLSSLAFARLRGFVLTLSSLLCLGLLFVIPFFSSIPPGSRLSVSLDGDRIFFLPLMGWLPISCNPTKSRLASKLVHTFLLYIFYRTTLSNPTQSWRPARLSHSCFYAVCSAI